MELLHNTIRTYAWGSHSAIAGMQGRLFPTLVPEAELWIGAHPRNPSRVVRDGVSTSLVELISADPAHLLGAEIDRFGPRLPFLLKLLAAERPLSLQAHPDAENARTGFAAEEAAAVPRDASIRRYADPYHKPELLVAVADFEALCGFRDPGVSARMLAGLGVAGLDPVIEVLRGGPLRGGPLRSIDDRLRGAVRALMGRQVATTLVGEVVAACEAAADRCETYRLGAQLGQAYPGDAGVLVALLLNQVRLSPGEAIWMPAGNLHGYLRGVGVEIMAASDNVLRGGLTDKHVDVPELLRVLRFEVLADPVVKPLRVAPGVVRWPTPACEFALSRVEVCPGTPTRVSVAGARVVFCVRGEVRVDDSLAAVTLVAGQAAIGPAESRWLSFTGAGEIFVATSQHR